MCKMDLTGEQVKKVYKKRDEVSEVLTKRKCRVCGDFLPSSRYFNHEHCKPLETDDGFDYPDYDVE